MKYRTAKNDTTIPVLGLGTFGIGGRSSADTSRDSEGVSAIQKALEIGYRHIDMAEVYGAGHSEELIGRAIGGFDRAELFITSKVDPAHLQREAVLKALDGSLGRLNTDYVDLYLIHWPNHEIPLAETFEALNSLVQKGKVKHLGVSNFDSKLLGEALQLSETHIVTNQVPFGLTDRSYAKNGVLKFCQEEGILLTAYSPVKKGNLDSKIVKDIAAKYEVTPAQIAIAWAIAQDPVITIPKSANPQHLQENMDILHIKMEPEDMAELSALTE